MVISTKHKFVSPKPDGADATIVRASNWNDEHAITMATARLMGRATAGAGAVEEISLSADLAFSGTVLGLSPALSASIAGKVPSTRTITAINGLFNGGDLADLSQNITIGMLTPYTLSSGTTSVAPTGLGHAHEINCLNVTSVGAGDMGYNTLGTECLLRYDSTGNPTPGINKSGSLLRYSSAGGNAGGGTPPGSWTCHGYCIEGGAVPSTSTVWRRYA